MRNTLDPTVCEGISRQRHSSAPIPDASINSEPHPLCLYNNSCVSSRLDNTADHARKYLRISIGARFQATHSLLPLDMSTCRCCEACEDVHALVKELAIRRVEHSLELHSHEAIRQLAEVTEVAPHVFMSSAAGFFFILQRALSFRTRHYLGSADTE